MNTLNNLGVKDSINCYRNINGKQYEQWTDFGGNTLEENKATIEGYKETSPENSFIVKKIYPEKFYRIYREVRV